MFPIWLELSTGLKTPFILSFMNLSYSFAVIVWKVCWYIDHILKLYKTQFYTIFSPWTWIFFFKLPVSVQGLTGILTHYQMTNFRLFQTERVCRRQFQISQKWKLAKRGKTLWEKEKLLITSNFSFSLSVFKRLVSQGCQKVSLCVNGLSHIQWQLSFCKTYS